MIRLGQLVKSGLSGSKWYQDTNRAAKLRFGSDGELWLAMFALTSPNSAVKANIALATKALGQLVDNKPFEGYLKTVKRALEHFRTQNVVAFGEGLKVKCFYANLMLDLEPVTVDRWIARAFGYKSNPKTLTDYHTMAFWVKELALDLSMPPAECQAAMWKGIQLEQQIETDSTAELIKGIG